MIDKEIVMMPRNRISTILAALCMGLAGPAWAAPDLISYQGRLQENGALVNGNRPVNIRLCDALTGGTCYSTGAQGVAVVNGIFRTTFTTTALPPGGLNSGSWFIEVVVSGNALSPREQLTTTPYAAYANMAQGLVSMLPVNELFGLVPVNVTVAQGSGYAVPLGNNLIVYSINRAGGCFQTLEGSWSCPGVNQGCGPDMCCWYNHYGCYLSVSGAHSGTSVISVKAKTSPFIAGPNDVIASTGASVAHTLRGVLVPDVVQVVLQDLASSGGSYNVPVGKTLYFGVHVTNPACSGTVTMGAFSIGMSGSGSQGGILNSGQSVTNNTNCTLTLNGYLK